MVGTETRAMREAALASAIAALEHATVVEAYADARTVRALIPAGVTEKYAAAETINAVPDAGSLPPVLPAKLTPKA